MKPGKLSIFRRCLVGEDEEGVINVTVRELERHGPACTKFGGGGRIVQAEFGTEKHLLG